MILVHSYMYLDHISFQREQSRVHQLRMTACIVYYRAHHCMQERAVFKIKLSPTRHAVIFMCDLKIMYIFVLNSLFHMKELNSY